MRRVSSTSAGGRGEDRLCGQSVRHHAESEGVLLQVGGYAQEDAIAAAILVEPSPLPALLGLQGGPSRNRGHLTTGWFVKARTMRCEEGGDHLVVRGDAALCPNDFQYLFAKTGQLR